MMPKLIGNAGKTGLGTALLLLFLFFWISPSRALGESYRYIDIHPSGWLDSRVTCINGNGEAVGFGTTDSGERGFLWSSGAITEILPPGADSARVAWINDSGDIAGTWEKGGVRHAFLLRGTTFLDPTPGWGFSEATYVGEDGAVGGTGEFGAFVSRDGEAEVFSGFSVVAAGNSSGELVGSGDNTARLYLPNQGYRNLTPPGTTSAVPRSINENGRVALTSRQSGTDQGFVFSDPFFVSMTPPGWTSSHAMAVNNLETVAGYGDSPEGIRSFLRSGGTFEILSFPGWVTTEAAAVNDLGQIAGSGTTASGETHAFVASPPGAAAASSPVSGSSGGCAIALHDAEGKTTGSAAASLIALVFPLLLLRGRVRSRRATPR
jgi:probable HAF family extracellular repeat protein